MGVATAIRRFFGRDDRAALVPLYNALVAEGRDPAWYRDGGVADTVDGRFDMIAALFSLVLLRLEEAGDPGRAPSALLTELFVDDMDGQLRQIGVGDIVVGKHIGRMMSAIGGRITAYREGLTGGGDFRAALLRNLYRGEAPEAAGIALVEDRLRARSAALAATPLDRLLGGALAP